MSEVKKIRKQLNDGIDNINKELKKAIDGVLSDDTAAKVDELKAHAEEKISVLVDGAKYKIKQAKEQDRQQMLKSINIKAKSAGCTIKRTVNKVNIKNTMLGKAVGGFIDGLKS